MIQKNFWKYTDLVQNDLSIKLYTNLKNVTQSTLCEELDNT